VEKEKWLIIHIDDIGMSYAANKAAINLFKKGIATSGSIMMPCPWAHDFIKWHNKNPQYDVGIHLTHTSEWDVCRWRPVSDAKDVPDLLDEDGFMWKGFDNELSSVPCSQVEHEIYAQINLAKKWGLRFTHIDSHMWVVASNPSFLKVYLEAASKYNIVPNISKDMLWDEERREIYRGSGFPLVTGKISSGEGEDLETKKQDFIKKAKEIKPGLNVLTIHPVIETPEIKEIIPTWHKRYLEYLLFMDDEVRQVLDDLGIRRIGWEDVKKLGIKEDFS